MTLYLYSHNMELIQIIAEELRKHDHFCVCFKDLNSFLCAINEGNRAPDLAVLDYTVWNHQLFNFVSYQHFHNLFLPFIYFNDPCPMASFPMHWEMILNALCAKFPLKVPLEQQDKFIENYTKVLSDLAEIINSDNLKPYIPLLQKPKKLPDDLPLRNTFDFLGKLNPPAFNLEEFKNKTKLPENLEFLLKIFLDKPGSALSSDHICNEYHKQSKQMTETSLGATISKLKKYLRLDENCPYIISSTNKVYTLLNKSDLK